MSRGGVGSSGQRFAPILDKLMRAGTLRRSRIVVVLAGIALPASVTTAHAQAPAESQARAIERTQTANDSIVRKLAQDVAALDARLVASRDVPATIESLRDRILILENAAKAQAVNNLTTAEQRYLAGAEVLADMLRQLNALDFAGRFASTFAALNAAGNPHSYAALQRDYQELTRNLQGGDQQALRGEAVQRQVIGSLNPWITVAYSVAALFTARHGDKPAVSNRLVCGFSVTTELSADAARFNYDLELIAAETARLQADVQAQMQAYLSVVGLEGGHAAYLADRRNGTGILAQRTAEFFRPLYAEARATATLATGTPSARVVPITNGVLRTRDLLSRYESHVRAVHALLLRIEKLPQDPRYTSPSCPALAELPQRIGAVGAQAALARNSFESAFLETLIPADRRTLIFGF